MKYHKIKTVYKRNPDDKYRTLIEGVYSTETLEYLADNRWEWTEKVDGTNIRVVWDGKLARFAGRTDKAQLYAPLVSRLQDLFTAEKLGIFGAGDIPAVFHLFGEGYGARIQNGGGNYIPDGVDFILFDVLVTPSPGVPGTVLWLSRFNIENIAEKLGIQAVPIVGRGTLSEAINLARTGFESLIAATSTIAEGLVMRPAVELIDRRGDRVMCKIKHKDFPVE